MLVSAVQWSELAICIHIFSISHVWMWELDCKENWAPKNWCFWTAVLEKTLESPLDCKEIQPVNPKGNQSWMFIGRTDADAETPILCPPHAKTWLIGKGPDAGREWGQEEKGPTEDEMAGWHHQLNEHDFGRLRMLVMDREAWRAVIHEAENSQTWLSNWTELNWLKTLYKPMYFYFTNLGPRFFLRSQGYVQIMTIPAELHQLYPE